MKDKRLTFMACEEKYLALGFQIRGRFGRFACLVTNAISDNRPIKEVFIAWGV